MSADREPEAAERFEAPPPALTRRGALALTFLTVAGACLRLWHLGGTSLWMDEGATVALTRLPWRHFAWVWWYQEGNMTAYYLLMRPWLHFGSREVWLRLPSVAFGVASIPALFLLARRLVSYRAALISSLLLAVNPAHVYYSREARSYSMELFFAILSALFFVRAIQQGRRRDWALWAACSIVALYAHYFAALLLVAELASLALLPRSQVPGKRVVCWSLLVLVLGLPAIMFVVLRGGALPLAWIPRPDAKQIFHLFTFLTGNGVKFAFYLFFWLLGLIAFVRRWRICGQSARSWLSGLPIVWAFLPLLLTVLLSLRSPVFVFRYLLVCLPAVVLIAAAGADTLRRNLVAGALLLALCADSVATDIRAAGKPVEDWRAASNLVLSSASPGDAVVFFPFYSHIMLDYYRDLYGTGAPTLHVFAPAYYGAGEDARDLLAALHRDPHQFQHVWVIVPRVGPRESGPPNAKPDTGTSVNNVVFGPPVSEQLRRIFGEPVIREFAGIDLLRYGK